ncbi:RISC-loading complex subunit tarbp2-like [Melanaphis sacchari]|uniref:RISC-loading complex subunit tarbp2-like n=1 Tax=Melanaphis sacchari TaxID=742174 RepID=UPI000DC1430A|nr:RISC-loading complex subunit tarbp2-like [Melanaphis sacchari]XP_025196757.1 RISC-loading complex subunit tarbp2-like [Melanaphis sacchari]XP_025196758.1 RISC-loading complex subunit tarbp2-like [Melanaphis sacchari]
MELNVQDQSAHICSIYKTPVTTVEEYAAKYRLIPQYDLIHNGVLYNKANFKYSLTLGKYVSVGLGLSKKEAKQSAALNLLKLMIDDNPELINTDLIKQCNLDKCMVSPIHNNVKVNSVGKLVEICSKYKLELPEFNLIKEEGPDHAKLFTFSCRVAKLIEISSHITKKQAKHLAAVQMMKKLMSIDKSLILEEERNESESMKILEQVEIIKLEQTKTSAFMGKNLTNYHLFFKNSELINSDILNKVVSEYNKNNELDLLEPFKILCEIVTECKMHLISKTISVELLDKRYNHVHILAIDNNVDPSVYGLGEADNIENAQQIAAKELLIGICILLK